MTARPGRISLAVLVVVPAIGLYVGTAVMLTVVLLFAVAGAGHGRVGSETVIGIIAIGETINLGIAFVLSRGLERWTYGAAADRASHVNVWKTRAASVAVFFAAAVITPIAFNESEFQDHLKQVGVSAPLRWYGELEDPSRATAAKGLGKSRSRRARSALRAAAADTGATGDVRGAATQALMNIPGGREILIELSSGSDPATRGYAAAALVQIPDDQTAWDAVLRVARSKSRGAENRRRTVDQR